MLGSSFSRMPPGPEQLRKHIVTRKSPGITGRSIAFTEVRLDSGLTTEWDIINLGDAEGYPSVDCKAGQNPWPRRLPYFRFKITRQSLPRETDNTKQDESVKSTERQGVRLTVNFTPFRSHVTSAFTWLMSILKLTSLPKILTP